MPPKLSFKIETLVSTPRPPPGRVQVCSFPRADLGCLGCSFLQRRQLGASSCLTTRLIPGHHVTEWTSTLDGWFFPLARCDSRARVCPFAGENVHWLPSFATRAGLQKRFGSKNHHDCSENLIISCNSPIHPTAARERRLASRSELADSGKLQRAQSGACRWKLSWPFVIRAPCPSQAISSTSLAKAKSSRNPLCFQSFNRGVHGHRHQKGASRLCHVSGSQLNRPDEGCPSAEAKEAKFAGRTRHKPHCRPPATPPEMIAEAPEAPDARSCGEHSHARRARHRVAGRVLSPHRSRRDAGSSIHSHAQSGTSARKPDAPRQSWLPPQMQRQLRWRRRRLA